MLKDLFLEGFRMPGEWEKQKSVWIVWPYNKKDWPGLFDKIPEVVSKIVCNLSINQTVNLIIRTNKDKVRIKLELKKDGTIMKSEILDHERMNKPGQKFYKVLAESALRAIKLCQPLRVPSTGYERWKELQLNFDAREMLEG